MIQLLIVDDEPLVQVGIKSMLNWEEMNIEVIGSASNGQAALSLIEEKKPDIVITDIKMPVMSGLELIRICREHYGNDFPYFLILTSYEDFHMVKEALTYQVSDYLVKLELTPDSLREAIMRVLDRMEKTAKQTPSPENTAQPFYDKFFIRLLHNLFETEEQFLLQSRDLKLDFSYQSYLCVSGELTSGSSEELTNEKQLALFGSSMQMIKELLGKYGLTYYSLSLDARHFALLFCFSEASAEEIYSAHSEINLKNILSDIGETLNKYYKVTLRCGIGSLVPTPLAVSESYQTARQACQLANSEIPVLLFEEIAEKESAHNSFNISLFREDLTKAFEEYDASLLRETLDALCTLFREHPHHYVQAMDGACNILFLAISLIQDGEKQLAALYEDNADGYRSLYKQTNVEQVAGWLENFSERLCSFFETRHKDYKNHIVIQVKKYIGEHLTERLSLNEVAAVFGISPNYLSQLFGKYNDVGFSEYINQCKINEAKKLLGEGNLKVYEVAEQLGFESAFYFSKVFKKVEGISPTEFINK